MRTAVRFVAASLVFAFAGMASAQQGDGLSPSDSGSVWSRWQPRVAFGITSDALNSGSGQGVKLGSLSVMGDYYFSTSVPSASVAVSSGFRATSGLIVGSRSTAYLANNRVSGNSARSAGFGLQNKGLSIPGTNLDGSADNGATPYLGVGYTGASAKSGWGFSADIGLMAFSPGSAVKLGRVLGGSQSLDDTLRDMRFAPLLQLGVSYSF